LHNNAAYVLASFFFDRNVNNIEPLYNGCITEVPEVKSCKLHIDAETVAIEIEIKRRRLES
jgi:hypothetical protein